MTYKESLSYLKSLNPSGIRLGLEPIVSLLGRMGNPQESFPSVIVAGTNGKGSVAAILASILTAAGFKTGLYTSPDLVDFRERIRIDGEMISPKEVVDCLHDVKSHVTETVSYFEFITAMAFSHFTRRKIDIAVLEVGLGGRLDATNVVNPLVSVITNISREHEEYLGNSLAKIAFEKGGVIKEGGVCVTAASQKPVLSVLADICQKKNARLFRLGNDFTTRKGKDAVFSYRGLQRNFSSLRSPFTGIHQIANAALALAAMEVISSAGARFSVSDEAVIKGLRAAQWEGRLEVLGRSPLFIVDGAHNPAGVATLARALENDFTYRKLVLIFGVMGDKNYRMMAKRLFPLADRIVLTRPPSERSLAPQVLAALASEFNDKVEILEEPEDALNRSFFLAGEDDAICAAGSLYLVGEMKRVLGKAKPHGHPSKTNTLKVNNSAKK